MTIAYVDCICGISGDMTLGGLIDVGVDLEALEQALRALRLDGWELKAEKVVKQGISATQVRVQAATARPEHGTPFRRIEGIISESPLSSSVKARALKIFRKIAEAEGRIHNTPAEDVHFHELGGLDSIVDIVGAVVGFDALGVEAVYCSPIPMSHGQIECAHGLLPVPAPAVAEMAKGLPTRPLDVRGETVTPTGIAIVAGLASGFGPWPAMTVGSVGYGAGSAEFGPIPNVLRIVVGEADERVGAHRDTVRLIEANIDDMSPEFYEVALERIFAAGALDVWLTPVQMKKGRPAVQLSVLCAPEKEPELSRAVFRNTTTLGVRVSELSRYCLPREHVEVETPYGRVRVKVARLDGEIVTQAPEYEDCKRAAEKHGVPLTEVYRAAASGR